MNNFGNGFLDGYKEAMCGLSHSPKPKKKKMKKQAKYEKAKEVAKKLKEVGVPVAIAGAGTYGVTRAAQGGARKAVERENKRYRERKEWMDQIDQAKYSALRKRVPVVVKKKSPGLALAGAGAGAIGGYLAATKSKGGKRRKAELKDSLSRYRRNILEDEIRSSLSGIPSRREKQLLEAERRANIDKSRASASKDQAELAEKLFGKRR